MDETTQEKTGSKKGLYIVIAIVVLLLIVWYFLRSSLWMVGGVPGVTVDRKLDGSTTYSNDENTVTIGSNTLPDNWPSDAPTYPNATVQYSGSSQPQTGEEGLAVAFVTTDSAQSVYDFYKKELADKGWTVEQTSEMGPSKMLSATKDTRTFGVYIVDSGQGQVTVTVGMSIPGSE